MLIVILALNLLNRCLVFADGIKLILDKLSCHNNKENSKHCKDKRNNLLPPKRKYIEQYLAVILQVEVDKGSIP